MDWIPSIGDAMKDYTLDTATSARSAPKSLHEIETASGTAFNIYPLPDTSNTVGTYSSAGEYEIHIPYRKQASLLETGGEVTNFFTGCPGNAALLARLRLRQGAVVQPRL